MRLDITRCLIKHEYASGLYYPKTFHPFLKPYCPGGRKDNTAGESCDIIKEEPHHGILWKEPNFPDIKF